MPQADLIYSLPDDHDALKDTVVDGSDCTLPIAQPHSRLASQQICKQSQDVFGGRSVDAESCAPLDMNNDIVEPFPDTQVSDTFRAHANSGLPYVRIQIISLYLSLTDLVRRTSLSQSYKYCKIVALDRSILPIAIYRHSSVCVMRTAD